MQTNTSVGGLDKVLPTAAREGNLKYHLGYRQQLFASFVYLFLYQEEGKFSDINPLTFKNRASYIQDGRTATLQMLHFIYIFFSTNICTEYFKHAAHSPLFSSKCHLFPNATFFWFLYYSHFTYRVCQNLNVKLRCQKVKANGRVHEQCMEKYCA